MDWLMQNWVSIGVALWALEKALELIARLTPWKWDDNIGVILAKFIQLFWKKTE